MGSKRQLERRLADLHGYDEPQAAFEQYPTPPEIAAHLIHFADLQGDLTGDVVDLGSGTGILALAAACRHPHRVIGVERDPQALAVAVRNERSFAPSTLVLWILGDATRAPLCTTDATVVMNPPFGAQQTQTHIDRAFLLTASRIASVSYSIHNEGSHDFLTAFTADNGGRITHRFATEFDLEHRFPFHSAEQTTISPEIYRIIWT